MNLKLTVALLAFKMTTTSCGRHTARHDKLGDEPTPKHITIDSPIPFPAALAQVQPVLLQALPVLFKSRTAVGIPNAHLTLPVG